MHAVLITVAAIIAFALITWQRDQSRFTLARMALERGLGGVPGMVPPWVISLRNGLSTLTLGIALIVVGLVALGIARKVHPPAEAAVIAVAPATAPATEPVALPMPPEPPAPAQPPAPQEHAPDARPPHAPHPPRPPGPPLAPPSPAMEQWRTAQERETMGLVSLAVGFILTLLGLVRVLVSRVEKRYTPTAGVVAPPPPPNV